MGIYQEQVESRQRTAETLCVVGGKQHEEDKAVRKRILSAPSSFIKSAHQIGGSDDLCIQVKK